MPQKSLKISVLTPLMVFASLTICGCAHVVPESPRADEGGADRRIAGMTVTPAPDRAQVAATSSYHFAMAQAYSAEGNPDRAIEEYKLTLMYDPNAAIVYARLATEYMKKGMLSQAMETCRQAIARDAKFTDARLILAGLYASTRQNDEAIRHYDEILKYDPANEEAAVYKAQALMDQGENKQALTTMRAFVKKNSESALGWYYYGRTFHKIGNYKEAEKAYAKAIDLRPSFTQALLSLGFLHEESRHVDRAIQVYQDLFEQSQDVTAAGRLSTIYLKQEKYGKAIPYLEAIEANDPDDMNSRVKLGLVYMEMKNYNGAEKTFRELIQKNPESDRIRFYLASLYLETERFDDAVAEFKRVPEGSKLYSDSALQVANILKTQGKTEEAKNFLREAIIRSPKIPQFYVFLASMKEDDKQIDDAIAVLERAYAQFPEDERVLYYLGSLYDRQGKVDKGLAKMEQLLFVNPTNVDALNYIGYTWTVQGVRLDEAEKMLKEALALKPGNPYIIDSWGWHLFVRGKTQAAITQLEKAASLKGDEPAILEHLGDAYARANLQEKALSIYQKAAQYAEESKTKAQLADKIESMKTILAQSGRLKGAGTTQTARSPASVGTPTPGASLGE